MVGQSAARLFTPEDQARGAAEHELEVAGADHPAEDDRWQERADGSRFWASGLLVGLRDAGGRLVGYAKVLRNRTSVKEQLETLRNQAQTLNELSTRREAFLSTVAHELANPLGPLTNAVHIIRTTVAPSKELEFALRVIERQSDMLRKLVGDLLEFSRVGVGKVTLDVKRLSLHDVLEQVVEDCRGHATQRRHELLLLLPRAPIVVDADHERLRQVFLNLVTNAIKYTHPGGRISVKATTEGEEAVVRIEDTGVGIPTEMLPRIFELFTQVETTRPMAQGGLGIGLALVKELVDLHGGSVQVVSEGPGKGSEFSVRLPLPRAERIGMEPDAALRA
jgi:two-component system CheB/CheR fusion protein